MTFGGGTGTVGVGEGGTGGSMIDPEMQQLKEELWEAQCTLTGEVQQIGNLARKNSKKVIVRSISRATYDACGEKAVTRCC